MVHFMKFERMCLYARASQNLNYIGWSWIYKQDLHTKSWAAFVDHYVIQGCSSKKDPSNTAEKYSLHSDSSDLSDSNNNYLPAFYQEISEIKISYKKTHTTHNLFKWNMCNKIYKKIHIYSNTQASKEKQPHVCVTTFLMIPTNVYKCV